MELDKGDIHIQVANAKLGQQSAYNFLLDRFWNEVYGFQIKRVQNEFEAEDITIETFAKAFDKIHTFKETFVFSTWLIAISKNIQIDKTRKKNAILHAQAGSASDAQLKSVPDANPTPEDVLITKQNLTQLLRDIKLLKPAYQEVIQLRYFQEMSYTEIALELGEPLSNIKVRLLRAKKLLAEIITKNNTL
ncbi:MAG: RNA polymerase sigma-70 factor (ECF subfamily) [Saprospiraceae bacterium]